MRIDLASITPRHQRLKSSPAQALVEEYIRRASRYSVIQNIRYESEAALLEATGKTAGRTPATFVLLDSRGQALTSEAIAERFQSFRDNGMQLLVCAIGPADGWSRAAWQRADLRLSFGAITLPHELALVLLAEQTYRALTILAGHPYHGDHTVDRTAVRDSK